MLFLTLLFLGYFQPLNEEVSTRWLVEVKPNEANCLFEWWELKGLDEQQAKLKSLPVQNWYMVAIPQRFFLSLAQLDCIETIAVDEILEKRSTIPNDPEFVNQSDMELIGMPDTWDMTTGGLTYRGDTIVVAAIDDGFQIDHEDLISNLWRNYGEIPDDGIDNDNNGYVDDYFGVNISTGHDNHSDFSHGTSVSGIIGASGNNGLGVTGVNWNVKIMLLSYNHRISGLIEAYQYVIDMRKKYNESQGKEGAFVVAVNLSSGLEFGLPQNFPLWCAMYDSLGVAGVLGVCSTSNRHFNVDQEGDLPSRCTSPYTIIVTNINPEDILVDEAGYGRISVDIGAPGEHSLTTDTSNTYNYFRGTSAATPHVTGTVALLYSSPCSHFFDSLDTNPGLVASQVKNVILSTGTSNSTLQGITVSGKRLQVNQALETIKSYCTEPIQLNDLINFLAPNPTGNGRAKLYFKSYDFRTKLLFEIYSLTGIKIQSRLVEEAEFQHGFITIDTRQFPSGVYIVSLQDDDSIESLKLIVK